jgi:hypothetical protein
MHVVTPTSDGSAPQAAGRRPLGLTISGIYLLACGVLVLISMSLVVHNIRYADELPWTLLLFGLCVQLCRIAAGALLLLGESRAVAACGVATSAVSLNLLVLPVLLGTRDPYAAGLPIAGLVDVLLTGLIWWMAYRWRMLGWLGKGSSQHVAAAQPQDSQRSPVDVMVLTLVGVQILASVVHAPSVLALTRTGELNAVSLSLLLLSMLLMLTGGTLFMRGRFGARYPFLAAVLCWLALTSLGGPLPFAGILIAASGFAVGVRRSAELAGRPR